MDPIVDVSCFYLALRFRQFRSPRLMRGVCYIFRDDEAFHIIMKPHVICGGLRDDRRKLLKVRRGTLVPVKGHCYDFHHHLPDGCCGRPIGSSRDIAEELLQVVLVDCSKIRSIRCEED